MEGERREGEGPAPFFRKFLDPPLTTHFKKLTTGNNVFIVSVIV